MEACLERGLLADWREAVAAAALRKLADAIADGQGSVEEANKWERPSRQSCILNPEIGPAAERFPESVLREMGTSSRAGVSM